MPPPNNRTPEPREADACRPYLERQVDLIKPGLIIALGKSAATLLLGTDATIASLRGRVHRYRGVPLIITYHPAYLLRNLPDKAKAWEDMLLARRTLATLNREAEPAAGVASMILLRGRPTRPILQPAGSVSISIRIRPSAICLEETC